MSEFLDITDLKVPFGTRHGEVTALSIMGLIPSPPGRIASGSIKLITKMSRNPKP